MNVRLILTAGSVLYSLYKKYENSIQVKRQMEQEDLVKLDEMLKAAKTLRYRFADYMKVVSLYGKDIADKCLNLTLEDVEKMNLKFYLVTR